MKTRLLSFVDELRAAGLTISVAETLDATRAVGVIGVEPAVFREALAAVLVKDEADRPTFDAVFKRFFAVPGRQRGKGQHPQPSEEGAGRGSGHPNPALSGRKEAPKHRPESERRRLSEDRKQKAHGEQEERGPRLARERALQAMPFDAMMPQDVEACAVLARELARQFCAHLSRRTRVAPRGRVDIRRTLRRSTTKGGVPIELVMRHRRPGRPDLIALCDFSHSVATASHFFLTLLAPAHIFFRRVRLFGFVDQPVEISLENDTVTPHDDLDLYARSDFGKVLVRFWERYEPLLTRSTMLLILGDARNNRRPPRADVVARIHAVAREVIWLNPEPPGRWNTGDSVMASYQRHCDAVLAAGCIRALYTALRRTFRGLQT